MNAKLILGCGYLGRRVARRWLARGDKVYALTRDADTAAALRGDAIEPILGYVLQPETVAQMPRATTVLYAIGFDRASGASMRQVYVDGLANVLDRLPRPQRIIYISSSSVYGQTDGGWVDEDSPAEPLEEFLDLLPTRLVQFRIYALDHAHDSALSQAAATVLNKTPSSIETNI